MKIFSFLLALLLIVLFHSSSRAQLSGSYTLGDATSDYVDMQAAFDALNLQGTSDTVIFNIKLSYQHPYQVKFQNLTPAHPVIFQSETQNPDDLTLKVGRIYESENITLKNLTIHPIFVGTTGYPYSAMELIHSKHIVIDNCIIRSDTGTHTRNGLSLVRSDDYTIKNTRFVNLNTALTVSNFSTYGTNWHLNQIHINNCTFDSCITGIRIRGDIKGTLEIDHNVFSNLEDGIIINGQYEDVDHTLIHGNIIKDFSNIGITIQSNDNTSSSHPVRIYNNMISGGGTEGFSLSNPQGQFTANLTTSVRFSSAQNVHFINNSVYGGMWVMSGENIYVQNNTFSNDASLLINYNFGIVNLYSDYNNYYLKYPAYGFVYGRGYHWFRSLDTLQANTGFDAHSISADPMHTSSTDLHSTSPLLQYAGMHHTFISKDMDEELRNNPPDIGADEFNSSDLPPFAYFRSAYQGGKEVQFTNMSVRPGTYQWDFGDGSTSTQTNPTHTFSAFDSYIIKLTVTNAFGSHQWTDTLDLGLYSGMEDMHEEKSFSVFPNPTSGVVSFQSELTYKDIAWEIRDVTGHCLEQKSLHQMNRFQIDMGAYAKGIYILILKLDDGRSESYKLIRE